MLLETSELFTFFIYTLFFYIYNKSCFFAVFFVSYGIIIFINEKSKQYFFMLVKHKQILQLIFYTVHKVGDIKKVHQPKYNFFFGGGEYKKLWSVAA